jgi:hypothetical protein
MTSIAVVILLYRVAQQIVPLIARIPPWSRASSWSTTPVRSTAALVRQQSDPRCTDRPRKTWGGRAVISRWRGTGGRRRHRGEADGDGQYDPS